jgi:DinB superfamily
VTPPQREELEEKLKANSDVAASVFERYSAAQLSRRPAEGSWSAAECVVHLSLTTAAAVPLLEPAVADLRSRGLVSSFPSQMDWIGSILRWSLVPPPRFKTRTTAAFQPLQVEPVSEVLPEFMRQQARVV